VGVWADGVPAKPNIQTGNTVLMGVYVSPTGNPDGPWNQIADYRKLANSGSALKLSKGLFARRPGLVQGEPPLRVSNTSSSPR
jgi:hypothetical protein